MNMRVVDVRAADLAVKNLEIKNDVLTVWQFLKKLSIELPYELLQFHVYVYTQNNFKSERKWSCSVVSP